MAPASLCLHWASITSHPGQPQMAVIHSPGRVERENKRKTAEPLTPASSYSSCSSSSSLFFLLLSSFALESSSVIQGRQAIVIQGPFEGKRNEETHARMKGGKGCVSFLLLLFFCFLLLALLSLSAPWGKPKCDVPIAWSRWYKIHISTALRISLWLVPGTILP